ncbi:MAG TPA: LacI family transcriptional regulator [Tessaracoccus flavescens]|uniref:LacI family transcriptional regulator n=1 Tax=Tessaracoccus flavescens TaxID=399497 RepID=A0A921ENI1_9ACTN|nr:LacI family transcriptional regulator [Tessaracoccus flavescens]
MSSSGAPTIIDVARAAGVSKSLVSLAIRDDPGVSAATRQRILEVADRIGYRSNRWARALVRGRTNLIGVLLNELDNPHNTELVEALEDAAGEQGLSVVLSHGRRSPDQLAARLEEMMCLGLDGFVVVSAHVPVQMVAEAGLQAPTVVVGNPYELPEHVSQVRTDDETGARQAVEHLIERGHRRIGFFQATQSRTSCVRAEAYSALMREHGLSPVVSRHLQGCCADVTAVFASNDRAAARLLGAASDEGRRVPDDLAVVGYDDTDLAVLLRPQLTTVAQPRAEMGRTAMRIVLGGGVERVVLDPELVVRNSS